MTINKATLKLKGSLSPYIFLLSIRVMEMCNNRQIFSHRIIITQGDNLDYSAHKIMILVYANVHLQRWISKQKKKKRPPKLQIRHLCHQSQSDLNKWLLVRVSEQTRLGSVPSRDKEQKQNHFNGETVCLGQLALKQQSSVSEVTGV